MQSRPVQWLVVAALALGFVSEGAVFAHALSHCDSDRILTAAALPGCCHRDAQDYWQSPKRDCCQDVVLEADAPAATGVSLDVPATPVTRVGRQAIAVYAPPAVALAARSRAYERPPPLASPVETIVLLN